MAAAVVNSGALSGVSAASPQTTATLGFTPLVDNVLYAYLRGSNAQTAPTVTDNINGAMSALGTQGSQGTVRGQWFKVTVITATAPTFTITWTGANSPYTLVVVEVSGSAGEDVVGTAATGSSTTPTSGNVVATASDLLLAGYGTAGQPVWSVALDNAAGASMTINVPSSGTSGAAAATLSEVAGTYAPRITIGTTGAWVMAALLIFDAAVGSFRSLLGVGR